jgi:hypothetical protein
MVFVSQVMGKRLDDTLPEHDRQRILTDTGVDVAALPNTLYRPEVICNSLREFLRRNRNLRTCIETVQADANFEFGTTERAV